MPYVIRDATGRIIKAYERAGADAVEEVSADSVELKAFMAGTVEASPEEIRRRLAESDLGMARMIEDLIDVLIAKGVIQFTDLPTAAGAKYLQRHAARERLQEVKNLIVDEKDII